MLINHVIQGKSGIEAAKADKVCLIHGDVRITYGELQSQTDRLARRLSEQIRIGDKVLVKLSDPIAQLRYFFAVIKAGGACILIDASTSEKVTAQLIALHQLDLYIDEAFQPAMTEAPVLPDIEEGNIFLGAFSSGSTGIPKLIWRDHQSWTSAFLVQSKVFNVSQADTLYVVGSLVYTANLNSCLHVFAEGGTVVIASNGMPRTWVREVADSQASVLFMVPANYRVLLKAAKTAFLQIKSVISCGAKLDRYTVESLMEYFPQSGIYEYYGASELGHVSYLTAEEILTHPGSVGKAFPGVTMQIVNETIWVESPYLAPQYRPKATVGDLGRIDSDGYLYLQGRKHGLINAGGVKVIPEQVEDILLQCPGIGEAVVSGIDDPIKGQKVCAWIVKSDVSLNSATIIDFCRQKMLRHCCPQKIVFIDAVPLTANGKVDRMRLQGGFHG